VPNTPLKLRSHVIGWNIDSIQKPNGDNLVYIWGSSQLQIRPVVSCKHTWYTSTCSTPPGSRSLDDDEGATLIVLCVRASFLDPNIVWCLSTPKCNAWSWRSRAFLLTTRHGMAARGNGNCRTYQQNHQYHRKDILVTHLTVLKTWIRSLQKMLDKKMARTESMTRRSHVIGRKIDSIQKPNGKQSRLNLRMVIAGLTNRSISTTGKIYW
jgi:hypothetical protein